MGILEIAYELYKFEWLQNEISPQELFDAWQEYYDYVIECIENDEHELSFDGWVWDYNNGFKGMMYVSIDEFEDNEFKNANYMKYLLSEKQFEIWKTISTFG
mgnify:CR=1 FL=1